MHGTAKLDPMLSALRREGRDFGGAPVVKTIPPKPALPELRPGDIELGELDTGGPLGLSLAKLIAGRLLIQALSGAGKSWTLRRLIEQTQFHVQQIVVDPEGDFKGLAEQLGLLHLEGGKLDAAALATAAARAREHRVSLVLDLSDLTPDDQMKALTAFLTALIAVPREHWHPCLVAIDEAHLFAPFGGFSELPLVRKACIGAMVDLMSRGRKRGLTGILATQRLARLHKSVVSDIQNFMIGLNTLDLDIRRAAETIGWDARKGFDRLPLLSPGEFVAVGAAFSRTPAALKVGDVKTRHSGATPELLLPEAIDAGTAAQRLSLEQLLADSSADEVALEQRARAPGRRAVREFMRDPAFPDAGRAFAALLKLAPDGARITALQKHLSRSADQVAAALALLDENGAVEFDGEGDARAVRLERGMTR
jgi:hypothetical protein